MLEKLITILAALVTALDNNTAALKASPVAPAKESKKTKEPAAPPAETPPATTTPGVVYPSVQDVRDAAKALLEATGNQDGGLFAQLNAKFGTKKISEVPETARAEVIAAIKAAMPAKTSATEQI